LLETSSEIKTNYFDNFFVGTEKLVGEKIQKFVGTNRFGKTFDSSKHQIQSSSFDIGFTVIDFFHYLVD